MHELPARRHGRRRRRHSNRTQFMQIKAEPPRGAPTPSSLMAMSHEQRGSRATGRYPPRSRMTHTPITNEVTLSRNITPKCSCSSGGHSHVSRDRSCVHEGVTTRRVLRRAHVSRTPASVVSARPRQLLGHGDRRRRLSLSRLCGLPGMRVDCNRKLIKETLGH